MQCPRCNTPLDEKAIFCGHCGNQIVPIQAPGATVVASETIPPLPADDRARNQAWNTHNTQLPAPFTVPDQAYDPEINQETQISAARNNPYTPYTGIGSGQFEGQSSRPVTPTVSQSSGVPTGSGRTNTRLIVFITVLLVLLIVGASAGVVAFVKNRTSGNTASTTSKMVTTNTSGTVAYLDGQGQQTDALVMNITGLGTPPSGSRYQAWMFNEDPANEGFQSLGSLVQQGQVFSLNFAGNNANLLGRGSKIEVTLENSNGNAPTGQVLLTAAFPPEAFVHIKHLLFQFPNTPHKIGLLLGLRNQVTLLNTQAVLLQNVAGNQDKMLCVAQSIIDIIEGQNGDHTKPLGDPCVGLNVTATGDGFGILGNDAYIASSITHAGLAANQPDATANIKDRANKVIIVMNNVKDLATNIRADALKLLANTGTMKDIREIVQRADQALNGVDVDGNGQVDPIKGEGGVKTAYAQAQLMAGLTFVAKP